MMYLVLFLALFVDPFAPKAEKPKDPGSDPGYQMALLLWENIEIPDADKVGIKAISDAKVFQTGKAGEMGSEYPFVRVYSQKSVEEVVDFYKMETPEGWKYELAYGAHLFFQGDQMKALMGQIPVIQVAEADNFVEMWPEAKSIITIYYE